MPKVDLQCKKCGKSFKKWKCRIKENGNYCSKECYQKDIVNILGKKEERKCLNCGKGFEIQPARKKKHCSISCRQKYKWQDTEYRKHMSEVHKGQESPMSGKKHKPESIEKMRISSKGQTAWNKGLGKATEHQRHIKSIEHKEWREAIFKRDDYTCQMCRQRGGKLNADHIKPYSIYKDLRYELSNGRTLCEDCHRKTDTYGGRAVRLKKQYFKNIEN